MREQWAEFERGRRDRMRSGIEARKAEIKIEREALEAELKMLKDTYLLDRMLRRDTPAAWIHDFWRHMQTDAARFSLDEPGFDMIIKMVKNLQGPEVLTPPPFPEVFIEVDAPTPEDFNRQVSGRSIGPVKAGYAFSSQWGLAVPFTDTQDAERAGVLDAAYDFHNWRIRTIKELFPGSGSLLAKEAYAFCRVFFTVLADAPEAFKHESVPGERRQIGKHMRDLPEHTKLRLRLGEQAIRNLITERQNAGRKRDHKVRGHYMNFSLVSSCDHEWVRITEKPLRERCSCCGQRRTFKLDHRRGDPALGTITHDYEVTT